MAELVELAKPKIDLGRPAINKKALVQELRAWDTNILGWSSPSNPSETLGAEPERPSAACLMSSACLLNFSFGLYYPFVVAGSPDTSMLLATKAKGAKEVSLKAQRKRLRKAVKQVVTRDHSSAPLEILRERLQIVCPKVDLGSTPWTFLADHFLMMRLRKVQKAHKAPEEPVVRPVFAQRKCQKN